MSDRPTLTPTPTPPTIVYDRPQNRAPGRDRRLRNYQEALTVLLPTFPGVPLDQDCPLCDHPEMSALLAPDLSAPLGVHACRQCGHVDTGL